MIDGAYRSPEQVAAERALALRDRLAEAEAQLAAAASRQDQLARQATRSLRGLYKLSLVLAFILGFALPFRLLFPW